MILQLDADLIYERSGAVLVQNCLRSKMTMQSEHLVRVSVVVTDQGRAVVVVVKNTYVNYERATYIR